MVMENTVPATPIVKDATAPSNVRAPVGAAVVERVFQQLFRDQLAAVELNEWKKLRLSLAAPVAPEPNQNVSEKVTAVISAD